MNAQQLDQLVADFAASWLDIADPATGEALVADPILVLGPDGTSPVPRQAFLAAVAARQALVDRASVPTTLTEVIAHALGERMVLATITWSFGAGAAAVPLVSDFLLERRGATGLRCVAYLPRTSVLDHVEE